MVDEYFHDLLKTKIYIPPLRDRLVPRPRLVQRLNSGSGKKLTLVQAPAGYGKTTLVIEWLSQLGAQHAMYSVDRTDNELPRFLTYIIFALKQLDSGICASTLPLIHSPDLHPTHVILAHLVNDLMCLEVPTILVVDDYHLIKSREIHEAVSFLIHNLPPLLQIVLVSRKELPFSVANLRASDQMLELGIFDLRFTRQETNAFVNSILNLDLPSDALDELDRKTEGWITSLRLALMGSGGGDALDRFGQLSGNDRLIAEYLLDEVIGQQPSGVRDFLLKTSILDRFCAPLCDTLLDCTDSEAYIRQLEESNLFVIPLDNTQHWYRYHHLFAEFLQNRLRSSKYDIARLYQQASFWHAAQGNREEAIEYSLKAGDYEGCAALIRPLIGQVISQGGRDRVIRWLSALPIEMLREDQHLWPFLVLAHLDKGTFGNAYRALDNLWGRDENILAMPSSNQPLIKSLRAGFLAALVLHTTLDAPVVKGLAQQSIDNFPADARLGRSIGFGHYGSACLHAGEIVEARHYLDKALEENKRENYEGLYRLWNSYRASVEVEAGNLHQARDKIQKVLDFATARGVRESNVTSNSTVGLGRILYEWNELEPAAGLLEEAVRTAESGEYLDRLVLSYQHYFAYLMAVRDHDTARQKISFARTAAAAYDNPEIVSSRIDALEIWIDIETGRVETSPSLERLQERLPVQDLSGLHEFKLHLLARAWLATGRYEESVELLQRLHADAISHERKYASVQIGISLARALALQGNVSYSRQILASILDLAAPEGYLRSFLDAGDPIPSLLRSLAEDPVRRVDETGTTHLSYIRHLLAEFVRENVRIGRSPSGRSADASMQLTPKELEVVELLGKGLSYAEIALQLYISENTLKTHIKHAYTKLNARNRTEAVLNLKRLV